jgi:GGDEF domain-containing protein
MSDPFRYPDYQQQYGSESPYAAQEWSTFLGRRKGLLDDIESRLALHSAMQKMDPSVTLKDADAVKNFHEQQGQNADGSLTKWGEFNRPPSHEELNQLYGAADFWGIPNAQTMDPLNLKKTIEARRLSTAGDRDINPWADVAMTSAAAAGLGITQDLVAMAQHIPFIGNAVAENHAVQQSSQWLASLNEGVQAGMEQNERSGYRIAHGLGGMLGYILPGEAAWKIAGSLGGLGAITSGAQLATPIARIAAAGVQGGLATWMLEGGGDQSNQEAAVKVGLGAAGGVVFGELLPRVFEKVKAAFPAQSDVFADLPVDRRGSAFRDNTVDAEWYFEADHQLPGAQGKLGAGDVNSGGFEGTPPGGAGPGGGTGAPRLEADWSVIPHDQPGPTNVDQVDPSIRMQQPEPIGPTQQRQLMSPARADMTERIAAIGHTRDEARRAMETDGLTGLGNKVALERARGAVDADPDLGWAVFDGKKFKAVNDTHGHDVGDQVLQNFARSMQQAAVEMNLPARLFRQGGDEFSAIVPRDQMHEFTNRVAELSFQRVGGVETQLQGYPAENFAEADLTLMNNKRGSSVPKPERNPVVGSIQPNSPSVIAERLRGYAADPELPASTRAVYERNASELERIAGQITPGNKGPDITPDARLIPDYIHEGSESLAGGEAAPLRDEDHELIDSVFPPDMAERYRNHLMDVRDPSTPPRKRAVLHTVMQTMEEQLPLDAQQALAAVRGPEPDYQAPVDLSDNTIYEQDGPRGVLEFAQAQLGYRGAQSEASNLTKQAQIMESATLPEVAAEGEVDEGSVVRAALKTQPGAIHIIRGIGDVGGTVRKLTQGMVEGRIMPHQFRMVERNGQMDMLVSDGMPISNKRAQQYETHGFFEGMNVSGGYVVKAVPRDVGGITTLQDPYTGQLHHVPAEQVMPGNYTDPGVETIGESGDALYNRFRSYVTEYMQSELAKLPPGHKANGDWLSPETSSQLPRLMEAFLDNEGPYLQNQISRAAVESYMNVRRVQDYQDLAPEEVRNTYAINAELDRERLARPIERIPIEDIAVTKGFRYLNVPGEAGGTLVDQLSDLRVPVAHEDAAYEFLRNFNRDVPDYTPVSDVPVEGFGHSPHAANPGSDLEPVLERGAEAEQHLADRVSDEIEKMIARVEGTDLEPALTQPPGGGGAPPPPRGRNLAGGGMNALPPGTPSLGSQFAEAARMRPEQLYRIIQKFDSAWLNYFTPFRSVTLQIENDLKNIGISEGTLWKHYQAVSNDVVRAHNEGQPWQAEYADIMGQFRRRLLRTGVVTRVQEIGDYNQKIAAMHREGYNAEEMAAQNRLGDFNDRFFRYLVDDPAYTINDSRYINAYMSHVRQRQGMPGIQDVFEDKNSILPQHLKFFAEMAREGNMQFRQMDARVLGTKMIRAAMFKKNVSESYNAMASAWDDPRIPTEFRELATDWLQVVRTGHNPNYDVAIQGVRHALNTIGVPITNGEVATLSNIAFGNMYRAQLGGRPDAIFRDSIQPLMTAVRIGFQPVAGAYKTFLRGGQDTKDMIQRGLDGGWLEKGQTKVANADVFEAGIQSPQGLDLLTPEQNTRREFLAKFGDMLWAATPKGLRNGLQGTRLDPLLYYTKLGEVNRLVSGEAGYQLAARALSDYQFEMGRLTRGEMNAADGVMWVDTADKLMADLMKASKARAYPRPIQDEFKRLVTNGDVEGAANLMGNEAANHQFRYGARENPIGIRKAGNVGRAVMQFGSFTTQYIAQMNEMLTGPEIPAAEKMAMGLRYGAVTGILGLAGAYTGWNFSKWMWHQSLTFAGGPGATAAYNALQTTTGLLAQGMGAPMSPAQAGAVRDFGRVDGAAVAGGVAAQFFPYTSTLRTIGNYSDMAESANPVEGTARAVMTGEASLHSDFQQWLDMRGQYMVDQFNQRPSPAGSGAQ